MRSGAAFLLAAICLGAICLPARAAQQPTSIQEEIRSSFLEQKVGTQVPVDAVFKDEAGQSVSLKDYLGAKPALLVLGYFTCPDLCPMTFRNLTEELNGIGPAAGVDFQVIIISFDPRDKPEAAAMQKDSCLRAYKLRDATSGWHFLTGQPDAISTVTEAVGFHYRFDQSLQRFVHPTGVLVLTPAGRVSHYFFGVDTSPADMESALKDAAANRMTTVDHPVQEYCVRYDPAMTPRGRWVTRILNVGCVTWAGILFAYIGWRVFCEVRHKSAKGVGS
jgi:protein SCO1